MDTSGSHVTGVSPAFDKDGKQTGWYFTGANQGGGPKDISMRAGITSHFEPLSAVGPGRSQFEIRHQIVKSKDGDTQTASNAPTTPPSAADQGLKEWPKDAKDETAETVKRIAAQGDTPKEAPKEQYGPDLSLKSSGGEKKAQFGGLFSQATRVLLGEAGPEMVLPLGRPLRDIDTAVLDHLGLRNIGGAARILINHKNAPPGISISTAGDLFKNVSMLRQMAFR
jgi:hypothetical protein